MDGRKVWLTLDSDGYYTLTFLKPVIEGERVYIKYGDPLGYRHICKFGAEQLFGISEHKPLVPIRVQLTGTVHDKADPESIQ
jgi:hypothetical protein